MARRDHKGREIHDLVCTSDTFASELSRYCDWFTGVPDTVLKNTQTFLDPYHFSSRENHAVAMAFGALMGGQKPCVLIQNSGLGLAVDALLGLFRLYQQGLMLVVSNRGELAWEEIQHQDWGEITIPLLETLHIPVVDFAEQGLSAVTTAYERAYERHEIVALLVHRGNLDE